MLLLQARLRAAQAPAAVLAVGRAGDVVLQLRMLQPGASSSGATATSNQPRQLTSALGALYKSRPSPNGPHELFYSQKELALEAGDANAPPPAERPATMPAAIFAHQPSASAAAARSHVQVDAMQQGMPAAATTATTGFVSIKAATMLSAPPTAAAVPDVEHF